MPNDSYFEHADVIEELRKEYGLPDLSQYEKLIVQKSNNDIIYIFVLCSRLVTLTTC